MIESGMQVNKLVDFVADFSQSIKQCDCRMNMLR